MCPASRCHLAFSSSPTFLHMFSRFPWSGHYTYTLLSYSHFQYKTFFSHLSFSFIYLCLPTLQHRAFSDSRARALFFPQESRERLTRESQPMPPCKPYSTICPLCKKKSLKWANVLVQIAKCICLNCNIQLSQPLSHQYSFPKRKADPR